MSPVAIINDQSLRVGGGGGRGEGVEVSGGRGRGALTGLTEASLGLV